VLRVFKELAVIPCAQDAVVQLSERIAEKVGNQRYNVWFRDTTRFTFADGCLRVSAPNHFVSDWIERHFAEEIGEAAREATGQSYDLSFSIDPELARHVRKRQPDRQLEEMTAATEKRTRGLRRLVPVSTSPTLRGRLVEFVEGPSNRLAVAAARSIIENPAGSYNPLFLHGGCGLGKTHLLQAVCNGLTEKHPQLRWRFVSGEEFTNDYIYSVRASEQEAFRSRYRNLDVLVIDDVHFFANKRSTQEEFLHTFNAIDVAGKQVVLASDSPPKLIGHFSEQLVSRFLAGMVIQIEPPDFHTRVEVLRRRARKLQLRIDESVLSYIAEHFCANIRELDGALLKIVAMAQASGVPVTPALAQRAVHDLVRQTAPVILLSDIESVVAIFFGLSPVALHTSRKTRTLALARSIAMYFARKYTDMSYPQIGRFMGNKNHATVILACRRVSKLLQNNDSVRWATPTGEQQKPITDVIQQLEERFHPTHSAQPA